MLPKLVEQHGPDFFQQVEPMVKGLIARQMREPVPPMLAHILMNRFLPEPPLQMPKQINRDDFLIRKQEFLGVITPTLILQAGLFIIQRANPPIELNELSGYFHNPTLQRLSGLRFYP